MRLYIVYKSEKVGGRGKFGEWDQIFKSFDGIFSLLYILKNYVCLCVYMCVHVHILGPKVNVRSLDYFSPWSLRQGFK